MTAAVHLYTHDRRAGFDDAGRRQVEVLLFDNARCVGRWRFGCAAGGPRSVGAADRRAAALVERLRRLYGSVAA